MTMTIATRRTAPRPEPLTGTLFDTAPPVDGRAELSDALYVSVNCIVLPGVTDLCADPVDTPTYAEQAVVDGIRFVTDLGIQCQALGWSEMGDDFVRALDLRESASVEQNLMVLGFNGADDITPAGGAVLPKVGLALLEGNAAKSYVGKPTIHSPRSVASLMDSEGTISQNGNQLQTALGSKFVAGAGYEDSVSPTGSTPSAGEWWLYASGEVHIERSKRIYIDPILNRSDNIMTARSQRLYVVDFDCYKAAVRVKLT